MSSELFNRPRPPYLHVAVANVSEITDFAWSLARDGSPDTVVRFLRGKKMTTVQSLYDEFAAALQFPYYFGENWNAFDECITDLEWLPARAYILVITNAECLLTEEDEYQLEALTNILEEAGNEWSQPVETAEAWGRQAVAFHVIFQCDEPDRQYLTSRIKTIGASFEEMLVQQRG